VHEIVELIAESSVTAVNSGGMNALVFECVDRSRRWSFKALVVQWKWALVDKVGFTIRHVFLW